MKKLKKILMVLGISLAVLFAGLILFVQFFDFNGYIPKLTKIASVQLNREVQISSGKLRWDLTKGIVVSLEKVRVSDDKNFSTDDFIFVEEVRMGVNIWSAIFNGQWKVTHFDVVNPRIQLIEDKNGVFNFLSIGEDKGSSKDSGNKEKEAKSQASSAIPVVLMQSLDIKDGYLLVQRPEGRMSLKQINFHIDDFSLTSQFPFQLSAAFFHDKANIDLKGLMRIDLLNKGLRLDDVAFTADLSTLNLNEMSVFFAKSPITNVETLQGKLEAFIHQFIMDRQGEHVLRADAQLDKAKVKLKNLSKPLENLDLNMQITATRADVDQLSFSFGEGNVTLKGSIKDYLSKQSFQFNLETKDINTLHLLDNYGVAANLEGLVQSKFQFEAKSFDPKLLWPSLKGEGSLTMETLTWKGINLQKMLIELLSIVPEVNQSLVGALPEKWQEILSKEDTVFSDVKFEGDVSKKTWRIKDSAMTTQGVTLSSRANIGFDQSLEGKAEMHLDQELAETLIEKEKSFTFLQDDQQRIYIPGTLSGTLSSPKLDLDVQYLSKKILQALAEQKLSEVLEGNEAINQAVGILFGDKKGEATESSDGSTESSPAKQIINVLDGLF